MTQALLSMPQDQLQFTSPQSYRSVHAAMKELGLINANAQGDDECTSNFTPRAALLCPAGHIPKPTADLERSCADQRFTCPLGSTCFCKPCIQAAEIEVYMCAFSRPAPVVHLPTCRSLDTWATPAAPVPVCSIAQPHLSWTPSPSLCMIMFSWIG